MGVMVVKEDSLMMLLLPEMVVEAQERYEILRQIHDTHPVGRHLLAVQTKLPENTVRKHIEKMEKAGLLFSRHSGITLTSKGESFIEPLAPYFQKTPALSDMEKRLAQALSMERVVVIRGDSDDSDEVNEEISQEAAMILLRTIRDGDVAAVSGGKILAAIADALPPLHMNVDIVPARGGSGRQMEYVPDFVAARIAEKLGGRYHMLQIPDGISPELFLKIRSELPRVRQVEKMVSEVKILLTGIDVPDAPVRWAELPPDVRKRLTEEKAVGEALGIYADMKGKVLYRFYNAGISREDISSIPCVIIAAGGRSRGRAILAMARAGFRGILITDEGAGEEILRLTAAMQSENRR